MANCINKRFLPILIYLAACQFIHYTIAKEERDLYSDADDVVRLNAQTFIPSVYHQNKNITYMVQFYNTFCGHCQMFAPTYKELGTRVKNWTSAFRLAGVDCSKDENINTCSENKIAGYPTIYLYPPNPQPDKVSDDPINLRELGIEWTIDELEETIINYMQNLTQTKREYPSVINALPTVDVTALNLIKRVHNVPKGEPRQDLMFVVESDKSYLGRKLILEYSKITKKLELRRISLNNTAILKALMKSEDYSRLSRDQPILMRVDNLAGPNQETSVLVRGEFSTILPTSQEHERHDFVFERFKKFLDEFYEIEIRETVGDPNEYPPTKSSVRNYDKLSQNDKDNAREYLIHGHPARADATYSIDLMKSIAYMLTHEIPIAGSLSPGQFTTIRNLLTIINKFLPLYSWDSDMANFISDLRTRLDESRNVYETDGIPGQQFRDHLKLSGGDDISSKYKRENWVTCLNSDKSQKGYTCSLWILFHTLTVGEYFKSAPVNKQPKLVLTTMRDYITKFFGCSVCSSNFEKEAMNLEASITARNSSVLWLWKSHNSVNRRLNHDKGNDKLNDHDVLYPSPRRCPKCIEGVIEEDYTWNERNVFEYLIEIYGPEKVIKPSEMSLPSAISIEEWDISTSDVSLCLVFYVSSVMIVGLVCLVLNPRWRHMIRLK